jgi:hypothetical protein
MPQSASCSFILGYTPDTQKPVVMVYAVVPVEETSAIANFSQLPSSWRAEVEGLEVFCCDRKTTELSPPVIFES